MVETKLLYNVVLVHDTIDHVNNSLGRKRYDNKSPAVKSPPSAQKSTPQKFKSQKSPKSASNPGPSPKSASNPGPNDHTLQKRINKLARDFQINGEDFLFFMDTL